MNASELGGGRENALSALRRGLPIILVTTIVATGLAVLVSLQQEGRYVASADVFVTQSVENEITGTPVLSSSPERIIATQAEVARVPKVADLVVKDAGLNDVSARALVANSKVIPDPEADLLSFEVTWGDGDQAVDLANAYAQAYVQYRKQIDTGSIREAQRQLEAQIDQVREIEGSETQVAGMLEEAQRLRTISLLRGSGSEFGRPATSAQQVQPRPIRNGLLGGILGLILGVSLVFLRETLNTRLRSVEEIEDRLGMPLMGRIPPPSKHLADAKGVASLASPHSAEAEAYRMLATNFELLNVDLGASSLMVASALHSEGKSTTAANLSVAFARRGLRVVLLEADCRRPIQRRMFGLDPKAPGLTDAALGRVDLDDALIEVDLTDDEGAGPGESSGRLEVLAGDPPPPAPGDFLKSDAVADLIARLEERSDLIVIDTPPLLNVSDAMGMLLSGRIDCVIVAAGIGLVRRQTMDELRRTLDGAPVVKLGFFATGADARDAYAGAYYGYHAVANGKHQNGRARPGSLLKRGGRDVERAESRD